MEDQMILEVEGEEVTLEAFLEANAAEDVIPLTSAEIEDVKRMEIGESMHIGITEIIRIG